MKVARRIFWFSTFLAAVIVLWVALYGLSGPDPVLNVPALTLAAAIWLLGLLARFSF
jgi:hypothetical protein